MNPGFLQYTGKVKLLGPEAPTGTGIRLMDAKGQPLVDEILEPGTYKATIILERLQD